MLSSPVPEPRLRPGWAGELKWDGFRALVSVDAGKVVSTLTQFPTSDGLSVT
jgi:ATP-dependent DNA ligase